MQRRAQRRRVAVARIAEDRGDCQARRAHLLEQVQREFPLLLEAHGAGDVRALTARGILGPALREIQRGADQPRAHARPERRRHGHLAVADLAQTPRVLARNADRVLALFRKARVVEQQHAPALRQLRPQDPPHACRRPRRVRDEMLEGLIVRWIGHAGEHRLHRLARAVAQQPGHVVPERHRLRPMPEAALERGQPRHQPPQHGDRVLVEHCRAAYPNTSKSTMSSKVITFGRLPLFQNVSSDLTK